MGSYYDKAGKPLELLQWVELFEDKKYSRIALTEVGNWKVSTVWLGIDHNFFGLRPHIFETMAWRIDTGVFDDSQERYSTLEEAQAGHKQWVIRYKRKAKHDANSAEQPE